MIGNNHSLGSRRPDLRYADDDAAKYVAILRTIAPGGVFLLADFDRDTERLFPDARALAVEPTRAELLRVGRELGERVRKAASGGSETDVYFVFAGHGDIEDGKGFIELSDARFTASDLERWLQSIPFTRAHVILDSCNSFFMLGARKPGGRYYATSEDAARALAAKLPNVGVFLSTSAEGEAFEWSEIQSGVFSYVVRSGLLGAADADGDGAVSYLELAAFVATATADVKNPNMRPHVFARGPGGRDELPILAAGARSGARTLQLTSTDSLHVRVRDREAVPLLDANLEARAPAALRLPGDWAEGAVVERARAPSEAPETLAVPAAVEPVTLASLHPLAASGAARGPAEIFQSLFTHPFGPRAVASYAAEARDEAPQVYGLKVPDDQLGGRELRATAVVHVEADRQVVLERSDRTGPWSVACTSPCDKELPLASRYRFAGAGVRNSGAFQLAAGPGEHTVLHVKSASKALVVAGYFLAGTGLATAGAGSLVLLNKSLEASGYGPASDGGPSKTAGEVMVAAGAAAIVGGIVMIATNLTSKVDQTAPPTPPPSDAWLRAPTWREDGKGAALAPGATTVPLFHMGF